MIRNSPRHTTERTLINKEKTRLVMQMTVTLTMMLNKMVKCQEQRTKNKDYFQKKVKNYKNKSEEYDRNDMSKI